MGPPPASRPASRYGYLLPSPVTSPSRHLPPPPHRSRPYVRRPSVPLRGSVAGHAFCWACSPSVVSLGSRGLTTLGESAAGESPRTHPQDHDVGSLWRQALLPAATTATELTGTVSGSSVDRVQTLWATRSQPRLAYSPMESKSWGGISGHGCTLQ